MVFEDYSETQRSFFIDKRNDSQPIKLRNGSSMKFFNHASNVENMFLNECQFSKQDIEESESKISDVLKCKDGVFNVWGKLT